MKAFEMDLKAFPSDQIEFDNEIEKLRKEFRIVNLELKAQAFNQHLHQRKSEIILQAGRLAAEHGLKEVRLEAYQAYKSGKMSASEWKKWWIQGRRDNSKAVKKSLKVPKKKKSEDEADLMMANAYRNGQLSQSEWKSWLETKAFCEEDNDEE